jgi:DNA-binding transcriptional LysR family regulator
MKLFDRMARGWTLTVQGRELTAQAVLLETHMQSLSRFALQNPSLSGKVRVSAPPLILSELVAPHLVDFTEKYPQIIFELIGETRGADLARGEADIALRMIEPRSSELVARTLWDVEYDLYGTSKWKSIPAAEHVFIGFDESTQHWMQAQLDKHVADRRYVFLTNDIGSMLHAASSGMGIALLPHFLAEKQQNIAPIDGLIEPVTARLYLVMHRDLRRAPRVRAAADYLIKLFQMIASANSASEAQ